MNWNTYFSRFTAFERRFSEEILAVRRGLTDAADTVAIMQEYADLYQDSVAAAATDAKENASPEEKEIWHRVHCTVLDSEIYSRLAATSDKLSTEELAAKVRWQGQDLAYFSIPSLLESLSESKAREDLDDLRQQCVEELNPLRLEQQQKAEEAYHSYGYGGQLDWLTQKKDMDYDAFLEVLNQVVAATDDLYQHGMGTWIEETTGLDFDKKPRKCHAAVLHRFAWTTSHFDPAQFDAIARARMAAMGFDTYENPAIKLDTEDRPRKNPRACVIPVEVPQEVWLLTRPKGTYDDYSAFFHEAGHALHYAHTDPNLPFAYRSLGTSHALTEFYSFLVQNSTIDAEWLARAFSFTDREAEKFVRELVLFDLFMFRRYVAKFSYELTDLQGKTEDPAQTYADTLTDLTGFSYSPVDYLADRDDGLYSADYLRAWIAERQLDRWLDPSGNQGWHQDPETGAKMISLWRQGDKPYPEALIEELGEKRWNTRPLRDWYQKILT